MHLTKKNVQKIATQNPNGTKVSIYIPTHPKNTSQNATKDTIRFKNALAHIISDSKYNPRELGSTVKQLESLLNDVEFWRYQDLGLAIFADANGYEFFNLPFEVSEMVYMTDHYKVSPLVLMQSMSTGFYILDVNLKKPRLFHGTHYDLKEVNAQDMPDEMEEVVGPDGGYRKQGQHHAGGSQFHGHGEEGAMAEHITRYLKLIASAVNTFLEDSDEPLILAGTTNRTGNLRPLLNHKNILDTQLAGNQEEYSETQLYDIATPIIANYTKARRSSAVGTISNAPLSQIAMGFDEIQSAAKDGRVSLALIPAYKQTSDTVRYDDYDTIVIDLPKDITEIEAATVAVLQQGGDIIAVELDSFENNAPKALCRF